MLLFYRNGQADSKTPMKMQRTGLAETTLKQKNEEELQVLFQSLITKKAAIINT